MKNILGKLHLIMSELNTVEKDKRNTMQNYSYASEYAIKKAVQPLLKKHKVVFFPTNTDSVMVGEVPTRNGGKLLITKTALTFTFYDVESGESISGKIEGTGSDSSDKGVYKAMTGAIKYALTSTFLIPTGDDAENDHKEEGTKKVATYKSPKAPAEQEVASSINDYPDNEQPKQEPKCAMHGIFMKERTGLSGQHFYDHRKQIEGVWNVCNGTGYKAQNK